jgi:hypothetical protein
LGIAFSILGGKLATTTANVHPITIKMLDGSKKFPICEGNTLKWLSTLVNIIPTIITTMAITVPKIKVKFICFFHPFERRAQNPPPSDFFQKRPPDPHARLRCVFPRTRINPALKSQRMRRSLFFSAARSL